MFRTVIEPTHAGQCVYLRLEDRGRYGWRGASTSRCFKLDARSESIVIFVYANARIIGRSLRVRAEFVGDRDHLSQVSAWSDFKVTH